MNPAPANSPYEPRFEFGRNWRSFLATLDDERILQAEKSLRDYLECSTLAGLRFLDVGCGSGLFSLAARRLQAQAHSFDYDPQCVACAEELKRRYFPGDSQWTIESGSALDQNYLRKLGTFDIVYSWGVLHHTGAMWTALDYVAALVAPGGLLFISIYNEQPYWTPFYKAVKRTYSRSPRIVQAVIAGTYMGVQVVKGGIKDLLFLRNPLRRYRDKKQDRGMSMWHDWIDWIGGYPFEAARPEQIFDFYRGRGFTLRRLKTCGGGQGCNEFVFARS